MTNILLHGACGKMGRAIAEAVAKKDDMRIICGIDVNPSGNSEFPVFTELADVPEDTEIDAVIDFSHYTAVDGIIKFCERRIIPAVIATTGLTDEQNEAVKKLATKVAVFKSANMSVGISLLKKLVAEAADFLGEDFDIEIVEKHHNQKVDAPSGTALAIADAINKAEDGKFEYVFDRHSKREKRSKKEIGISAIRGGNIVGDHDVLFAGNNEIIEINHRALSRNIFADGAVKAAEYIIGKAPGMYDMDMLASERK